MNTESKSWESVYYLRPKTRGELVQALHKGISCEVLASNSETTRMMIDAWLKPPEYIIRPSKNYGFVIFEPGKYLLK